MNDNLSVHGGAGPVEAVGVGVPKADTHTMINNYIGHSYAMLDAIYNQNITGLTPEDASLKNQLTRIYNAARAQLDEIKQIFKDALETDNPAELTKENVKLAKGLMKAAEKNIGALFANVQSRMAEEIGIAKQFVQGHEVDENKNRVNDVRKDMRALIKQDGNWWVNIKAFFGNREAQEAVLAFKKATQHMEAAANKELVLSDKASGIEREKIDLQKARFKATLTPVQKEELTRRVGVVGAEGIYRIAVCFDPKKSIKQLKSFVSQRQSDQERPVIKNNIDVAPNKKVTTELIPLNAHFDAHLTSKNIALHTDEFGAMFGTKGISTLERQGQHLVNAYLSRISSDNGVDRSVLRHGVLSVGKNVGSVSEETRKATSQQAAKELVKAALLQQIANSGKSVEEYLKDNSVINKTPLHLNSMSLLTPVNATIAKLGGQAPEIELLNDQLAALQNIKNEPLEINGKLIHLSLQVNSFNFGVNEGAVGIFAFGSRNQHEMNLRALTGSGMDSSAVTPNSFMGQFLNARQVLNNIQIAYKDQIESYNKLLKEVMDLEKKENKTELEFYALKIKKLNLENADSKINDLEKKLSTLNLQTLGKEMDQLMNEITEMMATDTAYLKSGNQYELAARIISLTHLMESVYKAADLPAPQMAFNCMSNKDRSGVMDCVWKSFVAMREANGTYPTREELDYKGLQKLKKDLKSKHTELAKLGQKGKLAKPEANNVSKNIEELVEKIERIENIQIQFARILNEMLLKSGSLDIIETSTGVRGYKVGNEANLPIFKHLQNEFSFLSIQGLGATTES